MWLAAAALLCLSIGFHSIQAEDEVVGQIYHPDDFDKNELCRVLNCQSLQVCLVRGSNAICLNKDRLDTIEGTVVDAKTGLRISQFDLPEQPSEAYKAKLMRYRQKLADTADPKMDEVLQHEIDKMEKEHHHTFRHQEPMQDCDEKELKSMAGRLLQWFSDVHASGGELRDVAALPRHKVRCAEDVSWMFAQWDGNDDGELTLEELTTFEGDQLEHCVRPFVDRCDTDADSAISADEWCDCFAWVADERHEPPCHAQLHRHDPHLLGAWLPRCDVDGFYRPLQCHERDCWCADRWGREFDGSRDVGGADCGQYADD